MTKSALHLTHLGCNGGTPAVRQAEPSEEEDKNLHAAASAEEALNQHNGATGGQASGQEDLRALALAEQRLLHAGRRRYARRLGDMRKSPDLDPGPGRAATAAR